MSHWSFETFKDASEVVLTPNAAGVVALAGHARFEGDSAANVLFGTLLALAAVTAAAVYKVTFKLRLGSEVKTTDVLSLLGTLGLTAGLFFLPLVLLAAYLNWEDRWWAVHVDWPLVFGSAGVDMIYNTALAFGLASCPSIFILFHQCIWFLTGCGYIFL